MEKSKTTRGELYHTESRQLSNGQYELTFYVRNTKGKRVLHKIIVSSFLSPYIVKAVTTETRKISERAVEILTATKNAVNP